MGEEIRTEALQHSRLLRGYIPILDQQKKDDGRGGGGGGCYKYVMWYIPPGNASLAPPVRNSRGF